MLSMMRMVRLLETMFDEEYAEDNDDMVLMLTLVYTLNLLHKIMLMMMLIKTRVKLIL